MVLLRTAVRFSQKYFFKKHPSCVRPVVGWIWFDALVSHIFVEIYYVPYRVSLLDVPGLQIYSQPPVLYIYCAYTFKTWEILVSTNLLLAHLLFKLILTHVIFSLIYFLQNVRSNVSPFHLLITQKWLCLAKSHGHLFPYESLSFVLPCYRRRLLQWPECLLLKTLIHFSEFTVFRVI